ncbi:hypothetical protein PLICRDRAFT_180960 [Plicaturopsis crispa FD-325 SS-3]|uniref:RING-type domain-containing protein n=1 Tax=Plicaturopsis crispa FD-325 SS-3 TaxID=944288 RepID=A0A0C9SJZ9_PLICR|nr:hypothetical protein PLICRDRAFT_180960 [Plicaturopsis crispa FD-325 SS-3]
MSPVRVENHPISSKRRRFATPHGRHDDGRDEDHAIVVSSDEESKRLAKKGRSQSSRKRGRARVPASAEPPSVDAEDDGNLQEMISLRKRNAVLSETLHDLREQFSHLEKSVAERDDNIDELINCEICLHIINIPRVLPCGHTHCQACLQKWFAGIDHNSTVGHQVLDFTCPSCRNGVTAVPPIDWKLQTFLTRNQNKAHDAQDDAGPSIDPLAQYFD